MNKQYKVFSAHKAPAPVSVTLPGGAQVEATVDSLEVQLVPLDGASGTVKLVFNTPEDIDSAMTLFVVDTVIGGEFTTAGA
jgi:hypothetical protein